MTIFDYTSEIPQMVKEDGCRWALQQKKEVYFGMHILPLCVMAVGTDDTEAFVDTVLGMVNPKEMHVAPIIQHHEGRPVKQIDCSKLCKLDAIGELYEVSKMDVEKRPIIVITNITDIPEEDSNHDSPEYVENVLLHGWKESVRYLTSVKHGEFTLETSNYTVLIPWDIAKAEKMHTIWSRFDNLAWLESYEKDLADWLATGFDDVREFLLKRGDIVFLSEG